MKNLTPEQVGALPSGPVKKFHLLRLYGLRLVDIVGDNDAVAKLSCDTICALLRTDDMNKYREHALDSKIGTIVGDKYFTPYHTGGNIWGWHLANPDTDDYALLTVSETAHPDSLDELGLGVKNPERTVWTVGVYLADGSDWSETFDIFGLRSAMRWCEIAIKNPSAYIQHNEEVK